MHSQNQHRAQAPHGAHPSARPESGPRRAAAPEAFQVMRAVYPLNAGLPHWIDFPRGER